MRSFMNKYLKSLNITVDNLKEHLNIQCPLCSNVLIVSEHPSKIEISSKSKLDKLCYNFKCNSFSHSYEMSVWKYLPISECVIFPYTEFGTIGYKQFISKSESENSYHIMMFDYDIGYYNYIAVPIELIWESCEDIKNKIETVINYG